MASAAIDVIQDQQRSRTLHDDGRGRSRNAWEYTPPIASKSVIPAIFLDWAGTVVDHGSIAPLKALETTFEAAGLKIRTPLLRRDMGMAKKVHIRKLLQTAEIVQQWKSLHRFEPTEDDIDWLYETLQTNMMDSLRVHSKVISGVAETVSKLRARGIRIAGTTGYTRPMLDLLEKLAATQGYATDSSLAPEDVGAGRPLPWMCFRLATELQVYPLSSCVKIGDTDSDMREGRNAGMWTIGLTRSGNGSGLTEQEWALTSAPEQKRIIAEAERELVRAGAHYTAESVAHILPILGDIEARIHRGDRP